jgi:hypothetical protein
LYFNVNINRVSEFDNAFPWNFLQDLAGYEIKPWSFLGLIFALFRWILIWRHRWDLFIFL